MTLETLIKKLHDNPEQIAFADVMEVIENNYTFTETAFTNGDQHNKAGENSGSCKVFSFAALHKLNKDQTLALFGEYYRDDVLQHPSANDHQNIRQFIQHSFQGISFDHDALTAKP